jgi:hypothetical protein
VTTPRQEDICADDLVELVGDMPFIGKNTLAYTSTTVWIEKQGGTLGLWRLWLLGRKETFLLLRLGPEVTIHLLLTLLEKLLRVSQGQAIAFSFDQNSLFESPEKLQCLFGIVLGGPLRADHSGDQGFEFQVFGLASLLRSEA